MQLLIKIIFACMLVVLGLVGSAFAREAELWRRVEVIRTAHGVPHIRAKDLKAAGYALAWMMLEDYGRVAAADLLVVDGDVVGDVGGAYGQDAGVEDDPLFI